MAMLSLGVWIPSAAITANLSQYSSAKPRVVVDAAHGNFHTAEGRYAGFAQLLKQHGYVVSSSTAVFSRDWLDTIDILVIANALHPANVDSWQDPILSAFTREEIEIVGNWVQSGGSLLLIADHYPFPAAAADLAAHFDFHLENGFAFRSQPRTIDFFTRSTGDLHDHPITRATPDTPPIEVIASFTGTGFKIPATALPLLELNEDFTIWKPTRAWEFSSETPRIKASGHFQGATIEFGDGRAAIFGEAAMFTDQQSGGFRSAEAPQNAAFILNTMRWLSEGANRR